MSLIRKQISNTQAFFIVSPVLWVISTSRWGSYLPREPFFFNDMLLLMAFFAASRLKVNEIQKISVTRLAVYLFIIWILIRAMFSFKGMDIYFFRDLAPYAYFAYIFPLRKLWNNVNFNQKNKIKNWLIRAFVFHFVWASIIFIFPFIFTYLPYINQNQEIKFFTIRPDFDGVLMAITAYLAIMKFISARNFINFSIFLICSLFVINQSSRASFISFALVLLIYTRTKIRQSGGVEKSVIIILLSIITFASIMNIVSDTTVGKKFSGAVLVFTEQNGSSGNVEGYGTTNARIHSWRLVLSYINAEPVTQIFGVGFGQDFMTNSRALRVLVASDEGSRELPRQPHNYALNTYARLGFLGFALYFFFTIRLLSSSFKNLGKNERDLKILSSLIFIAIVPISLLGVVMESPFGAITAVFSLSVVLEKLEQKEFGN